MNNIITKEELDYINSIDVEKLKDFYCDNPYCAIDDISYLLKLVKKLIK